MMVETAPVAALVVAKTELLLELLVVPLDPRLPKERCGKTNCSNNPRPNCVGIACPRRLPAIPALQKIGFYPIRGQRLKIQLRSAFKAKLAARRNPQPVVTVFGIGDPVPR